MTDETEKKYYWLTYRVRTLRTRPYPSGSSPWDESLSGIAIDVHPLNWFVRQRDQLNPMGPSSYPGMRTSSGFQLVASRHTNITLISWQEITSHEYELARHNHMADAPL